jgi:prepilin-type N-terminal cleavage/methylation domain-containing protein
MRTRAFSLIELLVVVSIITLLVALLLPAMGAARESARQAVCASHMKQLGVGVLTYVAQNAGHLVPAWAPGDNDFRAKTSWGPYAYPSWNCFATINKQVAYTMRLVPTNHGQLYTDGLITSGKTFYCPSMRLDDLVKHQNKWTPNYVRTQNEWIGTSYNYNPYRHWTGAYGMSVAKHRRLTDFPTDQPIMLDLLSIWRPDDVSHMTFNIGWNTLMIDGAVRFRGDRQTLDFVQLKLAEYPETTSAGNNWNLRFEPSLAKVMAAP